VPAVIAARANGAGGVGGGPLVDPGRLCASLGSEGLGHFAKRPDGILQGLYARKAWRTFAIISHPDAGKNHSDREIAAVWRGDPAGGRSQGARRRARSDWIAVERERGISVSLVVMSFEHKRLAFNLLDTPGRQDVSPLGIQRGMDRRLTAVDSAGPHLGADRPSLYYCAPREQTMRDLIGSAVAGLAMGVSAMVAWYIGSFIGNPIKELQVLRGKVIEQLIRLDHSNPTAQDLQEIIKQLHNIAAQTQAAFLSISLGFKGQYVKLLGFEPTKGAHSLLSLANLLNNSGTQNQLEDVKQEIVKAFKISPGYSVATEPNTATLHKEPEPREAG
jgi:hypothetical protein